MIVSTPIPARERIGFYVWNLSNQLQQKGHEVLIITRGNSSENTHEVINGITIFRLPFFPLNPFRMRMHSQFTNQLLKKLNDDIDLLHLHIPFIKAPNTEKPVVVTAHAPIKTNVRAVPNSPIGLLGKLQAISNFRIEQALFDRADALTAVTTGVAEQMQEYNIKPQDVTVLGNGVDTTIFYTNDLSQQKRFDNPNPYALAVAQLEPDKGLSDLVDCARIIANKLPNFRFLIAGAGPLEKNLRDQIKEQNLEKNVLLLGHIENRTRLIELYRNATIFVNPSHCKGLPTVLLEAMACGCAVVVTAVSGVLDVIHHRQNGLLVTPKIPAEIAESILELLGNPVQAKSLGQAAASTVQEGYAWQSIAERYLKEYGKFIKEHNMQINNTTFEQTGAVV